MIPPQAKLPQTATLAGILLKGNDYKAELIQRADQVNQLCALATTVKALIIKIQTGQFRSGDFGTIEPPRVHMTARGGCNDGIEFISEVLHDVKPVLISLCRDRLQLEREIKEFSDLTFQHGSLLDDGGYAHAHDDLNGTSLVEFTSRLTLTDEDEQTEL